MKEGGNMGWKFERVLYTIFPSRMRIIIMCEWDMVKTVTENIFPTMMDIRLCESSKNSFSNVSIILFDENDVRVKETQLRVS